MNPSGVILKYQKSVRMFCLNQNIRGKCEKVFRFDKSTFIGIPAEINDNFGIVDSFTFQISDKSFSDNKLSETKSKDLNDDIETSTFKTSRSRSVLDETIVSSQVSNRHSNENKEKEKEKPELNNLRNDHPDTEENICIDDKADEYLIKITDENDKKDSNLITVELIENKIKEAEIKEIDSIFSLNTNNSSFVHQNKLEKKASLSDNNLSQVKLLLEPKKNIFFNSNQIVINKNTAELPSLKTNLELVTKSPTTDSENYEPKVFSNKKSTKISQVSPLVGRVNRISSSKKGYQQKVNKLIAVPNVSIMNSENYINKTLNNIEKRVLDLGNNLKNNKKNSIKEISSDKKLDSRVSLAQRYSLNTIFEKSNLLERGDRVNSTLVNENKKFLSKNPVQKNRSYSVLEKTSLVSEVPHSSNKDIENQNVNARRDMKSRYMNFYNKNEYSIFRQ